MSWLSPLFLTAAAAITLPIALHFLRRWPRQPVVFPALRLLVPLTRRAQSRTQNFRRWLVLLLRCLALVLLAAVFARPFFRSDAARELRAVVVVVDNSLSLQASDRWSSLQLWARDRIGKLGPGDRIGVMLASPEPSWLVAPTTETERVIAALGSVEPGWQGSRLDPALRVAASALVGIPTEARELVVLTDHQRVAWLGAEFGRPLAPGVRLAYPDPAPRVQKQAALLPPSLTPVGEGLRVSVPVRNHGARHARTLRVYRADADTPLQEVAVTLGASDVQSVVVTLPDGATTPGQFRFSLDPDDLPADDTVYAVWTPRVTGTVLLDGIPPPAHGGGATDFVAAALKVTSGVAPSLSVQPLPKGEWPAEAVAVLRTDGAFAAPSKANLDAFLGKGGAALLFIPAGQEFREWLSSREVKLEPLAGRSEPWRVRDWQLEHPLVASIGRHRLGVLLNWEFRSGWSLPGDTIEPLARWSNEQVALGELRVGAGRVLLCGFAPDRGAGDWPASPSFVQFVHQACAYLLANQRSTTQSGEVGAVLRLPAAGQWTARLGPLSGTQSVTVTESVVPTAPGLYEFSAQGRTVWYAVNLTSEESDLAAWDAGTPWASLQNREASSSSSKTKSSASSALTRAQEEDAEQRHSLWWWAAVVAFVILIAELALANRTAR